MRPPSDSSADRFVRLDAFRHSRTLHDELTRLPASATVHLGAGVYFLYGSLFTTRRLNVHGEGMGRTVVVCIGSTGPALALYSSSAITISDLTLQGTSGAGNALISADAGALQLVRCSIDPGLGNIGVLARSSEQLVMRGCHFCGGGSGVKATAASSPTLQGCLFERLQTAMSWTMSSRGAARGNIVRDCGTAFDVGDASRPSIEANVVFSRWGALLHGDSVAEIRDNVFVCHGRALHAGHRARPTIVGNRLLGRSPAVAFHHDAGGILARNWIERVDVEIREGARPIVRGNVEALAECTSLSVVPREQIGGEA